MLLIRLIMLWLIIGHLVFGVSMLILWTKAYKHHKKFTIEWNSVCTLKFALAWPLYLVKMHEWLKMMNDSFEDEP